VSVCSLLPPFYFLRILLVPSPETLVTIYKTTRAHIAEDRNFNIHRREKLRPHQESNGLITDNIKQRNDIIFA
jgi:hypothetical protein